MKVITLMVLVSTLFASMAYGQHYNIVQSFGKTKTIAGIGTPLFSGDGGQAIEAGLSNPRDIAIDSQGNLYIADTGNNRIRKVDSLTGIITTVVGTGEKGFSNDGIGIEMKLNFPEYLAIDKDNNVIFVDKGNFSIRKLDQTTGKVVTLFKELNADLGQVLADKNGQIYFVKNGGSRGGYLYSLWNLYPASEVTRNVGVIYRLTSSGTGVRIYPEKDSAFILGLNFDNSGNILIAGENVKFSPLIGNVIENLKIPTSVYNEPVRLNYTTSIVLNSEGHMFFASSIIAYDEELIREAENPFTFVFESQRYLTVYLLVDVELGGGLTQTGYKRISDWASINYGQIGNSDSSNPLYGSYSIPKIITDKNDNILMVFLKDGDHRIKRVTIGKAYQPQINISRSTIDFGNVELGESKNLTVTFSNKGNMSLVVPQITPQNTQLKVLSGALKLSEGESSKVDISYQAQSQNALNSSLIFISNDPDSHTVEIPIKGTPIWGIVSVKQTEINFGNVLINSKMESKIQFENTGKGELKLKSFNIEGTGFQTTLDSILIPAGEKKDVTVVFSPKEEKILTSTITINTSDPNDEIKKINLVGVGVIPSVSLDLNPDVFNDQKQLLKGVKKGDIISIQIFGNDMPSLNGYAAVFSFEKNQIKAADNAFVVDKFIPNALPPIVTETDSSLTANIVSTGGVTTGSVKSYF